MTPELYTHVTVPETLQTDGPEGPFAGDLRIGDLTGNGTLDLVVYRSADEAHDGGGMKPCFLGACSLDGRLLWHQGSGGLHPCRPGPVAVVDLDGDGRDEIVCFWHDPSVDCATTEMADVLVQHRSGQTGEVIRQASPERLRRCAGDNTSPRTSANWCHQRILMADFRGTGLLQDFVVKLGDTLLAFDDRLQVLFEHHCPWMDYGQCPAYIPCVGDIDGDGRDEVNGGYFLLDHDGAVLWQKQLGPHMDSVAIAPWDDGRMRAICSGAGHVMDHRGNAILKLGEEIVPHGQELRVGKVDPDCPEQQAVIRYDGHSPRLMVVSASGEVLRRFEVNPCPNNTGMELVWWNGPDRPALIYNGGMLWDGTGQPVAELPGLPQPRGLPRQGWWHCIPVTVDVHGREGMVIYNPWDPTVYVYGPRGGSIGNYRSGRRQVNPRLMD